MGSTPRKYTQEYKDEAVRLALDSDRSLAEIILSERRYNRLNPPRHISQLAA